MRIYAETGGNIVTSARFYFLLVCSFSKSHILPGLSIHYRGLGPENKMGNFNGYWLLWCIHFIEILMLNSCSIPEEEEELYLI